MPRATEEWLDAVLGDRDVVEFEEYEEALREIIEEPAVETVRVETITRAKRSYRIVRDAKGRFKKWL